MALPLDPAGPPTASGRRRSVLVALALALVVATVGIGAGPAAAAVPGLPRAIQAVGYTDGIRLYFAPPTSDGGSPLTGYKISRIKSPGPNLQVITTWTQATSAVLFDTSAVTGIGYKYFVQAVNAEGTSPLTVAVNTPGTTGMRPAAYTEYVKFGSSAAAFITRQYKDFLGRPPTASELSAADFELSTTPKTPADLVDELIAAPSRANRQKVIRLYFAYFKRGPDHGGLTYWAGQLKARRKTINDVSNSFARSNEFLTAYGSLSNVGFVTLVYQNVLGRAPESSGLAYWTQQLDQHLVVRGKVMTQFSESNEFKNASRGRMLAADVWDATLLSTIPADELTRLGAHIQGGGTGGLVATLLMTLSSYHGS